jgi:hypothetical protein
MAGRADMSDVGLCIKHGSSPVMNIVALPRIHTHAFD